MTTLYKCESCTKTITDLPNFIIHLSDSHSVQGPIIFKCTLCQTIYDICSELIEHIDDSHKTNDSCTNEDIIFYNDIIHMAIFIRETNQT